MGRDNFLIGKKVAIIMTMNLDLARCVKRVVLVVNTSFLSGTHYFQDHHKTAFESLENLRYSNALPQNCKCFAKYLISQVESFMSMNKSGATLAWEYFSKDYGKPLIKDEEKRRYSRSRTFLELSEPWKNYTAM
jgi:hypothetical protein